MLERACPTSPSWTSALGHGPGGPRWPTASAPIAAIRRAGAGGARWWRSPTEDDDRAYAALAAGAIGCYLWDDPGRHRGRLAAGVARGEGALTPGWAGRILDEVRWLAREPGPVPAPELTPTELEVLRRIAAGRHPRRHRRAARGDRRTWSTCTPAWPSPRCGATTTTPASWPSCASA